MLLNQLDIPKIKKIARQAGKIIMQYYGLNNLQVTNKDDGSPVSAADIAANDYICSELANLYPQIDIISEENPNKTPGDIYWSIDPLDATKSFILGYGEFTVNIALINSREAIFGVVYCPLSDHIYYVDADNMAYKQQALEEPKVINCRKIPEAGALILTSLISNEKEKIYQIMQNKRIAAIKPVSSSIKICMIAEGVADIYPRFGTTMQWDTAAGHAILNAAGGKILNIDGSKLDYNKENFVNPHFIASGYN